MNFKFSRIIITKENVLIYLLSEHVVKLLIKPTNKTCCKNIIFSINTKSN